LSGRRCVNINKPWLLLRNLKFHENFARKNGYEAAEFVKKSFLNLNFRSRLCLKKVDPTEVAVLETLYFQWCNLNGNKTVICFLIYDMPVLVDLFCSLCM